MNKFTRKSLQIGSCAAQGLRERQVSGPSSNNSAMEDYLRCVATGNYRSEIAGLDLSPGHIMPTDFWSGQKLPTEAELRYLGAQNVWGLVVFLGVTLNEIENHEDLLMQCQPGDQITLPNQQKITTPEEYEWHRQGVRVGRELCEKFLTLVTQLSGDESLDSAKPPWPALRTTEYAHKQDQLAVLSYTVGGRPVFLPHQVVKDATPDLQAKGQPVPDELAEMLITRGTTPRFVKLQANGSYVCPDWLKLPELTYLRQHREYLSVWLNSCRPFFPDPADWRTFCQHFSQALAYS